MPTEIQIINGIKESTFPLIKLTKSLNGKTGTATFLFANPSSFSYVVDNQKEIKKILLIGEKKIICTENITIFFKNGKPFLLKIIFIFKNSLEWFDFLNFMNNYSKEKGFLFEPENFD